MAKLIIIPQGMAGALGITIGQDVIAYYPFEETADFATVIDYVNNFNGTTLATQRVAGYLNLGLPITKSATKNFEVDKVLDEVPSTKKFCIEFWAKLSEEIRIGEHRTHTIFSKQWTSGMKLFAYFVCRLETLQLHIEYTYLDITGTARTETTYVTIAEGIVPIDVWHKFTIQLDLRDGFDTTGEAWYSKYGVYYNDYYAVADTLYFVNIPQSFALTPVIIGGDLANLKIATNDSVIDIIVDNLPFASSNRYGIEGVLDEAIVRRNLQKALTGTTERPRLYIINLGSGVVVKDPEQVSYLPEDTVELTATPDAGWSWRRWHIASGTVNLAPIGTVSLTVWDVGVGESLIEIKEDLVPSVIPVLVAEGDWYIKFTSGALDGNVYKIKTATAGTAPTLDSLTIEADLSTAVENDTFIVGEFLDAVEATVNAAVFDATNTTIDIDEDLIPAPIPDFDTGSFYYIQFTAGALIGQIFKVVETVAGVSPALDQIIVEGDASSAVITDTFDIFMERSDISVTENLIDIYVPAYTAGSENYKVKFTSGILLGQYFDINDSIDGTLDLFTLLGNLDGIAIGDTFIVTIEDNPVTVEIPTIDRTVYAEFGGAFSLTVTVTGNGSVTINPDKEDYGAGEVVVLTAVPDAGYYFAYWETDLTGSTNPASLTMNANKVVNAVFNVIADIIYISHNDNLEGTVPKADVADDIYISHDETIP
jgi:hypothetical protein